MELFLIRHADAMEADSGMTDAERPLSDEGLEKMRKGAKGLRNLLAGNIPPLDAILTSPLRRALETARIIAGEVNDSEQVEECDFLAGDFRWEDLKPRIEQYPATARVAVVGHEPSLGRLAAWLTSSVTEGAIPLKKGSAICFEIEEVTDEPHAEMLWFLTPKHLRMLR